MTDSYIIDAVRTPLGKLGGALASVRPDDLLASTLAALVVRTPSLDPATIGEVYAGNANGAGEDNRNVARMATLLAGLPVSIPAATVNRLCASGLEAIVAGARTIETGDADIVVSCGVESMTRAPWVVAKPDKAFPTGHEQLWNSALGWRMVNPKMPEEYTVALGEGAEILVDEFSISRAEQDAFAAESHRRAADAWAAGAFDPEMVAVPGIELARDECIRNDSTLEALAKLRPVFRQDGTVTAGNSSPMNDGAAAVLLASQAGIDRMGVEPLARVVARATHAVEPQRYGIGPVGAVATLLERAKLGWGDIDAVELNEAFASQALACLRSWPDLDPAILNPQGGAIAIGHPLGCSGVRIVTTLAHHLRRTGGRYGIAVMCIGVGQGMAILIENATGR